jgi:hypothetical protein
MANAIAVLALRLLFAICELQRCDMASCCDGVRSCRGMAVAKRPWSGTVPVILLGVLWL